MLPFHSCVTGFMEHRGVHGDDQERSDENVGGRHDLSCRTVLFPGRVVHAINQILFVSVEYLRQNLPFGVDGSDGLKKPNKQFH